VLGLTRSIEMKKFSKKGVLLFAGAMAICAFVLPSVASAASWGPIGGPDHVLDSPNVGFTSALLGQPTISQCTSSSFTTVVVSAADAQIRAGTFGGLCTASSAAIGDCTVTTTTTGFPWTLTAVTTSNIQLHGVDIDLTFEDMPARPGSCTNVNGAKLTITGTLTGGTYTGPGRLDFHDAEGLVSHSALGNNAPITTRGVFIDTNTATPITVS
jgi:hypothetical protein